MPNTKTPADPDFPEVVGFELPAAAEREGSAEHQITLVMLNTVPSAEWVSAFLEQSESFQALHRLLDVRIVGSTISLIGHISDARTLTSSAKQLVENTSELRTRRRQRHRSLPTAALTRVNDGQDDARAYEVTMLGDLADTQYVLSEVIRMTGMRFAAIARVTDTRWTACAVYDRLELGLKPGQDLVLESTICNEIRQERRTIAFGQATTHPVFAQHHAPKLYGFESYLSVPIWAADGSFFGAVCALDPKPAVLGPELIGAIELFASRIGQQLPASAMASASAQLAG